MFIVISKTLLTGVSIVAVGFMLAFFALPAIADVSAMAPNSPLEEAECEKLLNEENLPSYVEQGRDAYCIPPSASPAEWGN